MQMQIGAYQAHPDLWNAHPDLKLEAFDAGFLVMCIIFIFLGSCGVLSNGRAFFMFFQPTTVRLVLRYKHCTT